MQKGRRNKVSQQWKRTGFSTKTASNNNNKKKLKERKGTKTKDLEMNYSKPCETSQ